MKIKILLSVTTGGLLLLAACKSKTTTSTTDSISSAKTTDATMVSDTNAKAMANVKPKGPAPAWAPDMKPQMQAVIEKLASYGDKPIPQLTAVEARKNHTPTDAVKAVMADNHIPMPVFNVDTVGKDISVAGGMIHIRIYTPKTGKNAHPMIVYYHGGGFVIANLDVYDATPNILADKTDAVVISVAYRLAPEHKFPTAHNDAFAAYQWAINNAASIKGDPKKIAVVGESAGGNLAVNMAICCPQRLLLFTRLPVQI
jgi:acetyl esterase